SILIAGPEAVVEGGHQRRQADAKDQPEQEAARARAAHGTGADRAGGNGFGTHAANFPSWCSAASSKSSNSVSRPWRSTANWSQYCLRVAGWWDTMMIDERSRRSAKAWRHFSWNCLSPTAVTSSTRYTSKSTAML